jgi:hypothetical protein
MSTNMKFRLSLGLAVLLPFFFVPARSIAHQESPKASPWIVFVGTIESVNAVSLASLQPSANTSVVVVEKVIGKPEAVTLAVGDRVTVLTEGTSPPKQGVRGRFFTEGWIFGETLAVRVLRWETVSAGAAALSSQESTAADWVQAAAEKDLQASLKSADIVVVGRVLSIQDPSVASLTPSLRQMVSEHNPEWQEAVVEVQETLKGSSTLERVVVRFPSSPDVMWVGYPKFKAGQEGTFLLRQDNVSGASTGVLEGKTVTAYMATSPKDIRSKSDVEMIKRLPKN